MPPDPRPVIHPGRTVDPMTDCEGDLPRGAAGLPWMGGQRQWASSWRRLIFPAVFLVYLLQPLFGVHRLQSGPTVVLGYAIVGLFAACYLLALPARWSGRDRAFWLLYAALFVLVAAEIPLAHEDAFPMCIYIAILGIASAERWAIPLAAGLALMAFGLPALVPSWHAGVDVGDALSVVLVSLAMWAFFSILRANRELSEARAEVAGLAAENERNRIARDLHDLLGHSLTTITVKAALAKRLAEADPARAAREIGEVEELARRALTDVRAAVSSYREMTLAGELASAQEVLRAAGVTAHVLTPTDVVRPDLQELFAWVTREGVTNVVRHSRAGQCSITLGPGSIEITDDGIGGSVSAATDGLIGLRERVTAAGGTLEAGPRSGVGWRLAVSVPQGATSEPADAPPLAADHSDRGRVAS